MRDTGDQIGPEAIVRTAVAAEEVAVAGTEEGDEEVAAGEEIEALAAAVVAEIARANKLGAGVTARSSSVNMIHSAFPHKGSTPSSITQTLSMFWIQV